MGSDILFYFLIATHYIALAALFGEMIYISFLKPSKFQIQMVIILFSTLIMLLGYSIELYATNAETAMIGIGLAYIGKPYVLLLSLLFIANYCGRPISKKISIPASILVNIFPLIIFTNGTDEQSGHMLYYNTVGFNIEKKFSPIILGRGPLYLLYILFMCTMFVLVLYYIISEFLKTKSKVSKGQLFWFFMMYFMTLTGYIIYISGLSEGFDTTMTGASFGTFCLTVIFFKYKLFDSLTTAKEHALYHASTGLLVLNDNDKPVYTNAKIEEYLHGLFTTDELIDFPEDQKTIQKNNLVFGIKKNPIQKNGKTYGLTIEIEDITTQYNYNAQLQHDVHERAREIRKIQRSVISSFAGIVEARDNSTGAHVKRISKYVGLIANSLKDNGDYTDILSTNYISRLIEVAPLHDVGKLAIPDSILLKPGKLTPEEFEVIKTHSREGSRILKECLDNVERPDYVELARNVANYHHEKWDGSGYPEHLSGQDIPLCARIIAVADVYDAIRSERCYKPPMSFVNAKEVICEGRGIHFDPVIVDAFLRVLPEIEKE